MSIFFFIGTLLLSLMSTKNSRADEYLYPVANDLKNRSILWLYQHGQNTIIFECNCTKKEIQPITSSYCSPACVKMLPDGSGISFIDNGSIRIKKQEKRSPERLELSVSLQNIYSIDWIDTNTCLVNASFKDFFGAFLVDLNGNVSDAFYDGDEWQENVPENLAILYTQYNNGTFYCVVREQLRDHMINKACFKYAFCSVHKGKKDSDLAIMPIVEYENTQIVAFRMKNNQEGFVLIAEDENDEFVQFGLVRVNQRQGKWIQDTLFSFKIPTQLLDAQSSEVVFEGLSPFIPVWDNAKIYFSDCVEIENRSVLHTFYYDCSTCEVLPVFLNYGSLKDHFFGFLATNKGMICGGSCALAPTKFIARARDCRILT